jgi:dihydroxyacetone kinase-like predicted kinase
VVQGGATLNPSTYELLAGIHAVDADEVIVLPNSQNVILAAERAAELSERPVHVVPTRAQQTGLAALLAFDPSQSSEQNAGLVGAAAEALRTGGVAHAARDDAQGRFREGDALGYAGEDLVVWGELSQVLVETIARVAEGCEVLTCIAGDGAPLDAASVEGALPDGVELDWQQGDQPAWWYLLAAE